jgi:hypothetical protein
MTEEEYTRLRAIQNTIAEQQSIFAVKAVAAEDRFAPVEKAIADLLAISLCANCATVFDEAVRPKFYKALEEYGCAKLPASWRKDNKISEMIDKLL